AERGPARADPRPGAPRRPRAVRPPGPAARGPAGRRRPGGSAAPVGPQPAEAAPRALLPALEHHLVDREVVARPGPEHDAGHEEGVCLQVEGADDVDEALAGEVGASPTDRL